MSGDLDALLDRWAERSRLTEAEAATILRAVVSTPGVEPPALDAAWWQELVGRVSGLVVQVTTMPAAARTAMLPPAVQLMTPASTR
ncbi:MAG TPA: hypothetical protein VOB72_07210 [Candidatus Dormibacteraeota bacterium]|nr:hypothetical protein [Candidatus Dormibacteraeota bacterium]